MRFTADNPLTLFCLHYLGGSANAFAWMQKAFEPNLRLVPIDLPGFGHAATATAYSVSDMADAVLDDIRPRAAGPLGLMGHSMGAKVATVVVSRVECKTAPLAGPITLILLAGSPPSPEPMDERQRATMLTWFRSDDTRSADEGHLYIEQNVTCPLRLDAQMQALADLRRMNSKAWSAWLTSGSRENWSDRVGIIDTPALLLAGENDRALGAASQKRWMAPHFSRAELRVLADTAHLIPLEAPKSAAQLIAQHVAAL